MLLAAILVGQKQKIWSAYGNATGWVKKGLFSDSG